MRSDLVAEINTDHLAHNCRVIRSLLRPTTGICAVVKADAYAHGLKIVAPALQDAGVDCAAVATLQEALELRSIGWRLPILVLGGALAVASERERRERLRAALKYDLMLTIADLDTVKVIARMNPSGPIDVHLKVDTGMGRMGVLPEQVSQAVEAIGSSRVLRLTGIYSHFATADMDNDSLALQQCETFRAVLADLGERLPPGAVRHMANSAATLTRPDAHFDMVRTGLLMYGLVPAEHLDRGIDLKPALRLTSHLTSVKDIPPGHCVGYGKTFVTKRRTRLGVVPIGYFDGYLRSLSNKAVVGTSAGDAPVVGRVSMDSLALDLTDLPPLQPGAAVTLIDDEPGRPNSVPALARLMDTVPYEALCVLGNRIERVAISRGAGLGKVSPAIAEPAAASSGSKPPVAPAPTRRTPRSVGA